MCLILKPNLRIIELKKIAYRIVYLNLVTKMLSCDVTKIFILPIRCIHIAITACELK